MKLRRLHLHGFKTFARRSEIEFDRGITAVVGPNGSGKSNVIDAIRWALGETNARELRGARMDEVIYSGGSGSRGRMQLAEVELTFERKDGSELALARRVARGSESEYRVDGERTRLRDIDRLLDGTGLAQSGYSVIAQNDIDSIIQATPAQRRALVEQAAGIRMIRAATDDSVARVGRIRATQQRLDDFLREAEPRLAELAEQSAAAMEQRELTARLTELRGNLAREEWRAARGRQKQAQRRYSAAAARLEEAQTAEAAFSKRHQSAREKVVLARESQRNAAAKLEAARLALERALGDTERWRDRLRGGVTQRANAVDETALASSQAERAHADLLALTDASAEESWADAATQIEMLRQQHEKSREALAEATKESLAAETAALAAAAARDVAIGRVATLQSRIDSLRGGADQSRREHQEALELQRQAEATAVAASERHQEASLKVAQADGRVTDLDANAEALQREIDLARRRLEESRQFSREAASQAALHRGQVEGAWGGVGVIADSVNRGQMNGRRLIDCFHVVESADEVVVAAALEGHLGDWVVESVPHALSLLNSESAREGLLAPSGDQEFSNSGGARAVLEMIQVDFPAATPAISALLKGVVLAESVSQAHDMVSWGAKAAVTRQGELVTHAGVRAGGHPARVFELAALAAQSEQEAFAKASQEQQLQDTVAALASDFSDLARARAGADTELREAQRLVELAAVEVTATRAEVHTLEIRVEQITALADQHQRELGNLGDEVQESGAAVMAAEEEMEVQAARRRLADATVEGAAETERSAAEQLRNSETDAAGIKRAASDNERQRVLAQEAGELAQARYVAAELRLLGAETTALAALVRGGLARSQASRNQTEVQSLAQAAQAQAPDMEGLERELASLELERSETAVALARANDEAAAAAEERDAADALVAELAEAVRDDEMDEGPEPDAQAAEKSEREIVRIERKISALGLVNAFAPEEHAALDVRVGAVRDNRSDLVNACRDINALAGLLTREAQKRFDTVFEDAAQAFGELFAELFPGGRATLRLEAVAPTSDGEEDDEAKPNLPGVEILAQPAGKRLQPLSLLSGGERALTALATILALQRVNPSPFYVFDEVDAPLDDSNIGRFTRLIQRLSKDQQFVVVTHNHATMAAADVLYGVTIDADGVSGIVSVRLTDRGVIEERELVGVAQSLPKSSARAS